MNINIGDLLILGEINGHPATAGIVRSLGIVGHHSGNELSDTDYVCLNDDTTPWQIWEIKQILKYHIKKEMIPAIGSIS